MAKRLDSRSQISRYGWMQPTHMRSATFLGKFSSGSRISASRSDLLKLPSNILATSSKVSGKPSKGLASNAKNKESL